MSTSIQLSGFLNRTLEVSHTTPARSINAHCAFCCRAFAAFAAFFRLLRTITILKKLPTTALPRRIRMTGMRIAHTRGGKRVWRK